VRAHVIDSATLVTRSIALNTRGIRVDSDAIHSSTSAVDLPAVKDVTNITGIGIQLGINRGLNGGHQRLMSPN